MATGADSSEEGAEPVNKPLTKKAKALVKPKAPTKEKRFPWESFLHQKILVPACEWPEYPCDGAGWPATITSVKKSCTPGKLATGSAEMKIVVDGDGTGAFFSLARLSAMLVPPLQGVTP